MSTRDDGGPVHPVRIPVPEALHAIGEPVPSELHTGISLRDYFAALAPADIPAWFDHGDDLPPLPAVLHHIRALALQAEYEPLPEDDKETLRQWMSDGSWDLDEPLAAIGAAAHRAIDDSIANRREVEHQRAAERYFAWRWFYADAMLGARSA